MASIGKSRAVEWLFPHFPSSVSACFFFFFFFFLPLSLSLISSALFSSFLVCALPPRSASARCPHKWLLSLRPSCTGFAACKSKLALCLLHIQLTLVQPSQQQVRLQIQASSSCENPMHGGPAPAHVCMPQKREAGCCLPCKLNRIRWVSGW